VAVSRSVAMSLSEYVPLKSSAREVAVADLEPTEEAVMAVGFVLELEPLSQLGT
jgi:hypothetical protein